MAYDMGHVPTAGVTKSEELMLKSSHPCSGRHWVNFD